MVRSDSSLGRVSPTTAGWNGWTFVFVILAACILLLHFWDEFERLGATCHDTNRSHAIPIDRLPATPMTSLKNLRAIFRKKPPPRAREDSGREVDARS